MTTLNQMNWVMKIRSIKKTFINKNMQYLIKINQN